LTGIASDDAARLPVDVAESERLL